MFKFYVYFYIRLLKCLFLYYILYIFFKYTKDPLYNMSTFKFYIFAFKSALTF